MIKNAPPPFSPATYGKRQMFPKPMAEPAVAAIAPNLEPNESRLAGSPDINYRVLICFLKLLFPFKRS
jgi:hypothetical protein